MLATVIRNLSSYHRGDRSSGGWRQWNTLRAAYNMAQCHGSRIEVKAHSIRTCLRPADPLSACKIAGGHVLPAGMRARTDDALHGQLGLAALQRTCALRLMLVQPLRAGRQLPNALASQTSAAHRQPPTTPERRDITKRHSDNDIFEAEDRAGVTDSQTLQATQSRGPEPQNLVFVMHACSMT